LLLDLNQLASAAVESGLLMLNQLQKPMLIMVMVDTDVMDMVDTDTDVDTDMEDTDTISARDLLMLKPSHTTVITVTHMPMDITHMAFIMLPKLPLSQRPVSLDIQEQPPLLLHEAHKDSEVSDQLNHGVTDTPMDSTDTHTTTEPALLDTLEEVPPTSPEAHKVLASK
jgi:hypothetical protein